MDINESNKVKNETLTPQNLILEKLTITSNSQFLKNFFRYNCNCLDICR